MITKREYDASDGAIAVLYAKRDGDQTITYPVLVDATGKLIVSMGMSVPRHNQQVIDEADPANHPHSSRPPASLHQENSHAQRHYQHYQPMNQSSQIHFQY